MLNRRNAFHLVDWDAVREKLALVCKDKSLTQQSQKEDADINVIVKRFGVTGVLNQRIDPVLFSNFEGIFDYQSAQNALVAADRAFMALPAETRARFLNDPQRFVEFCSNKDNVEEMRKMGLAVPAKKEAEPPIVKVRVVPEEGVAPKA